MQKNENPEKKKTTRIYHPDRGIDFGIKMCYIDKVRIDKRRKEQN